MQEFTFKPAVLGAEQVWTIKDGHVMRRGGKQAFDLSTLKSATWGDMTVRGTRSAWLHLQGGSETFKIVCNESGGGRDRRAFLGLVAAICDDLDTQNRGVPIRLDGGAGFSTAMFVIGALGMLGGLFFAVAGALDWVKRGNALAIGGGLAAAAGLGYMAWTYAPWRQVVTATPSDLAKVVRAL